MSIILLEGFDDYGPTGLNTPSLATQLAAGGWTNGNIYTTTALVAALTSEPGYAINLPVVSALPGGVFSQTLPANYSRLIGGFRFNANILSNIGITFADANTSQFSVLVEQVSGYVVACQGYSASWGATPPYVARSSQAVSGNTTHYLEFDITFSTSATGGVTVWLDGVQVLHYTGITALSANSYANMVQFVNGSSSAGNVSYDDFYLFNSSGSTNNAVLLSNPVIITQAPISDYQTQFTNVGNVVGDYYSSSGGNNAIGGNQLYLQPFTPNVNCTLQDVVLMTLGGSSNAGAHLKGVLYADNSGIPGSLLSSGTQVTGFLANAQLILPLATPTALTAGTQYWFGFITDSLIQLQEFDGVSATAGQVSNTYASGPPSTAPALSYPQPSLYIYGLGTGATTNWESVAINPPIGDQSSISGASIGLSDLYTFATLPANINNVYAVGVKGSVKLSVAGTHTIDFLIKSGTTTGAGDNTGLVPTLSYENYASYFDTDPNTGVAWTVSGVNNSYSGMAIIS